MSSDRQGSAHGHRERLSEDDWQRIAAALRYMGRDLHHRSFEVTAERRTLLWQETDACLQLADRLSQPGPPLVLEASATSRACALVTGASSGIGAALARALAPSLAAAGMPLVLTARRLERLEELAEQLRRRHGGEVLALPQDLAAPAGVPALLAELRRLDLSVHTLVNNAGFGLGGRYDQLPWEKAETLLQLMVVSRAALCHAVLPAMRAAGSGRILNVASLAGLVPGLPGSVLYSASKAFLIRLSQSLALENQASGVRVLALCPGYVRTEFHAVLGVEERMRRNLPGALWMDADRLAQRALAAFEGRQAVVVPGAWNRLIALLTRVLPDPLVGNLSTAFSRRYRRR